MQPYALFVQRQSERRAGREEVELSGRSFGLVSGHVFVPGGPSRWEELIERLWSRKRQLQRDIDAFGRWTPEPPVA
jgi:hypothetical protein